jgi:hypothetical protein
MRSFVNPGTTCPDAPTGAQNGWFRYVTANHDQTAPFRLFNRWHLMDLQRFALVPLPASAGGPAGASTAWDTFWGTCLSDGTASMDCEQNPAAARVSTSLVPGVPKTTQENNPAPDAERIAIPADAREQFPDGLYQVVAIANPYGQYGPTRGISCTTIALAGMPSYAPSAVTVDASPATCYVPATMQQPTSAPTGRDPMVNAQEGIDCTLQTTGTAPGHCWLTAPQTTGEAPFAPHPPAISNISTANTVTGTNTVPVAIRASSVPAPTPRSGANNPPATASGQPATSRRLTVSRSKSYTRTALTKQFGSKLTRVRITCKVRTSTASTCKVSWKKSGYSYKGHVWLRYKTVKSRLRWQYRVEVKKARKGHKTTTVKRGYKTGGTF